MNGAMNTIKFRYLVPWKSLIRALLYKMERMYSLSGSEIEVKIESVFAVIVKKSFIITPSGQ